MIISVAFIYLTFSIQFVYACCTNDITFYLVYFPGTEESM